MCKRTPISCQEYPTPYLPQRLHSWVYLPSMLGSGDGARSTLNSTSKPGTQNKTTQKPGARTAHERGKRPNTTKHKTGPRQKAHQRQAPGEPDRRGQKGQGGSQTLVSQFTFWEGPVLGSAPFLCGSVLGSAPCESPFLSASLATRPAWSKGVPSECQLGDSTKLG